MTTETPQTPATPDGAASVLTEMLGVTFRSHFEEWCRQVITEKDGGIDAQLHTVALSAFTAAYRLGFLAAVDMVRDKDDRYGIGNMCSMWRAEDVAEDLLQRAGLTPNAEVRGDAPLYGAASLSTDGFGGADNGERK